MLGTTTVDSPLGELHLAFRPDAVVLSAVTLDDFTGLVEQRLGLPTEPRPLPRALAQHVEAAAARGDTGAVPVDLSSVSAFQAEVLGIVATIPAGEVRTYGWLAEQVGRPRAVRAVGTAVGRNPVPVVVPCHRVVRSDGRIGEYSMGGPAAKRTLLAHEGVDIEHLSA